MPASIVAMPAETATLVAWPMLDDVAIARFAAPSLDWFASHLWFDTLARAAAPAGLQAGCVMAGGAIVPVWQRDGRPISGQSSPYSLKFAAILPLEPGAAYQAGLVFAGLARRRAILRLDALDPGQPELEAFLAGIAASGLVIRRFSHFGAWDAPVGTDDFGGWLATRPGALRSTITRKLKAARAATRFELIDTEPALAAGIAAFEQVYRRSWKQPEPFATFNATCMRALAGCGLLRLGILSTGAAPIAAQYWAVSGGRAMLLKLAHDEGSAALSPGTVLTARMIGAILQRDRPGMLDFGRGDDPYKRLWVDHRRERIGVLLINPRRPAGVFALARTGAGALRRYFKRGPA